MIGGIPMPFGGSNLTDPLQMAAEFQRPTGSNR
jgi:hypothetical protein